MSNGWITIGLLSLSLAGCAAPRTSSTAGVTASDVAAIRATIETYRTAWLAADTGAVLAMFTDDAVLIPHHGDPPVVGIAAIEAYWFGSTGTVITDLQITTDQIDGDAGLAFARGRDSVAWTTTADGVTRRASSAGTYLNVMKRMADGSWRIHVHMWDDPATQVAAPPP